MTDLIELLRSAGLTGRGGAGFPTDRKLRLARDHGAELIVNACDGEVGAEKDGWIVRNHLPELIDGARLIAGDRFRVAAHRGSDTLRVLSAAAVPTLVVPNRYVSSEASALASLAAGGTARPLMRFAPTATGAHRADGTTIPPTVVLNAETVWRAAQITRFGPGWFRGCGTVTEPGPRLITIGGSVQRPGVHEVAAGIPIIELIRIAGGTTARPSVLWFNGLSGGFLTAQEAIDLPWSSHALAPYGVGIGSASVRVLDGRTDPWRLVLDTVTYAAGESAGQCGPCMFGLPAVVDDLTTILDGNADRAVRERFSRRLGVLPGRGACRHPDGVASFLRSALRTFGASLGPDVGDDLALPAHRHEVVR
ncbi:NADH-ubiquinone oxidoreductase-F iron-sulfur binding region domain-containing protein [Millisia brevis]|uniref:NADH-ubiquinone oxidoreductase-F iron-sulfur binding region domain-containing protein n=1 Tax=Millisia brevis TaxID=264148 RepID=UPI0009FDB1BD|nr:NADH-ubiquinone oxidoreductase-F iron-sulfur binding region domain-containing protein [Millisia brevis]